MEREQCNHYLFFEEGEDDVLRCQKKEGHGGYHKAYEDGRMFQWGDHDERNLIGVG